MNKDILTLEDKKEAVELLEKALKCDKSNKIEKMEYQENGYSGYPVVEVEYEDGSVQPIPVSNRTLGLLFKSIVIGIYRE